MNYEVMYTQFLGIPRYGFLGKGIVSVDSGAVRLSGKRVQGIFLVLLIAAGVVGLYIMLKKVYGFEVRGHLGWYLFGGIAGLLLLLFKYKLWLQNAPVRLEKRLVTDVARDGAKLSFRLPDPRVMGATVEVFLEARSLEQAMKLENELRT